MIGKIAHRARISTASVGVGTLLLCLMVHAADSATFDLRANDFWLNLHSFLYVLGRAHGTYPTNARAAVRDAPGDAERGLQTLNESEKAIWQDAVDAYADGLSKREPTVDEPLAALVSTLATAGSAATLKGVTVDADTRAILERAAPIYRKTWWPMHRAANRAYRAELGPLIDRHGRAIVAFLTKRYGLSWAATPYQVHLSTYATWGAAYSTPSRSGQLIVVSTNAHSGTHGLSGLEAVFHEAMHAWDDAVDPLLRERANAIGRTVPPGLTHALIFFTVGEGVRRVASAYVTVGETEQMWNGIYRPFRAGLEGAWKPYLDGRGTRDEALTALLEAITVPSRATETSPRSTLFTFETDELWLNLHHFLYVLGMVEAKVPDATNPAMADAAPDAERGARTLNRDEQAVWTAAVHSYATGLSLRSNLDRAMVVATRALADVDDAPSLSTTTLDPAVSATLERAAPMYRRVWWPSHLAANRARRAELDNLIARYGATTIDYISRIYGQTWPAEGFPVHMSAFANFGGAYSVAGGPAFLVFSSMTDQNRGLHGFELVVHEGMHQWDQALGNALAAQARARNVAVPRDLTHAMIFFTAGEAVRRLDPNYVPVADAVGVWKFRLSGAPLPAERLKPILEDVWKPYMNGRGTREQALGAIVERAAAVSK